MNESTEQMFLYPVLEISQIDLEVVICVVLCSETLPDVPSILGNLAGISV